MTFILLDYESKDSTHWHHHFIFKTRHYPTVTAAHIYITCISRNIRIVESIPHMWTLYIYHTPYTHTKHNPLQATYTHTTYTTHVCTHSLSFCPIIVSQAAPTFSSWLSSLRSSLLCIHQPSLASLAAVVRSLNPRLTLTPPLSCPLVFTTVFYV